MRIELSRYLTSAALLAVTALVLGVVFRPDRGELAADPQTTKVPQVKSTQLPLVAVGPARKPAYTVYMGRRAEKGKAAKRMNMLHQAMAAKGYAFSDLEAHHENADLKGWWITYTAESSEAPEVSVAPGP